MASHFVVLLALAATLRPAASFTPGIRAPGTVFTPGAYVGSTRSRFNGWGMKKLGMVLAASGDENVEDNGNSPLSKEPTIAPDNEIAPPSEIPNQTADSLRNPPLPMLAMGAVIVILVFSAILGSFTSGDGGTAANTMAAGAGTLGGTASSGMTLSQVYDPRTFQPVCSASDQIYRYLQSSALVVVGKENYETYAPLIAGGILRVRLELCVLESFVNEAIVPFVREKGLSWVAPLHETVETFLAGTVFAVATNFILLGSTKIVAVLVAYVDVFFGLPSRFIGRTLWDSAYDQLVDKDAAEREAIESGRKAAPNAKKARNAGGFFNIGAILAPKPAPEPEAFFLDQLDDVWRRPNAKVADSPAVRAPLAGLLALAAGLRLGGATTRLGREACELLDTFVGRYLVYATFGYVTFKVLHFKVFNDFLPF